MHRGNRNSPPYSCESTSSANSAEEGWLLQLTLKILAPCPGNFGPLSGHFGPLSRNSGRLSENVGRLSKNIGHSWKKILSG